MSDVHRLRCNITRFCLLRRSVAYADDVSLVVANAHVIERINEYFERFEHVGGAKLNRQKTVAIGVGGSSMETSIVFAYRGHGGGPWTILHQFHPRVGVCTHLWQHSLRRLTLLHSCCTTPQQLHYGVASVLPPYCVHMAKITATVAVLPWSNWLATRRLAVYRTRRLAVYRTRRLVMCKALLANRHLQESGSLPCYQFLLDQEIPPPADLPCVKLFPPLIREQPCSDQIHRLFWSGLVCPRKDRSSKTDEHHPAGGRRKLLALQRGSENIAA